MRASKRSLPLHLRTLVALLFVVATKTASGQSRELGCGLHASSLQELYAHLESDQHPDLKGIVILCAGQRVSESYFNGDDAETLHDIRSATKSITATLMGIAIEQGWSVAPTTQSLSTCRACLTMANRTSRSGIC